MTTTATVSSREAIEHSRRFGEPFTSSALHSRTAGLDHIASSGELPMAELQQRFFVIGKRVLELERNPILVFDPTLREVEVSGWNLRIPYDDIGEIGRRIQRKFLTLFRKAESIDLTEDEESEWREIVKQVNYRRFCIDRAMPRYVEGTFVEMDCNRFRIEWNDGEVELVSVTVGSELAILDPGERFGAFAKFGISNRLTSIEQVNLLEPLGDVDGEKLWDEWPTNR